MDKLYIYVCEDSIEGVFTAIYDAWDSGHGHKNNYIQIDEPKDLVLFSQYIYVTSDLEKTKKVTNTIKSRMGNEAYRYIYYMLMSNHSEKADVIYRFVVLGLHYGAKVMDYLSNDYVSQMAKTFKRVSMESHHYKGFIRFSELSNNILLSKIRPDNNILPLVAAHFSDRFQMENFIIIDERRGQALVHPAHKNWFIVSTELMDQDMLNKQSNQETVLRGAWNAFVENISIKERENLHLQQNMCPLRYREFMPEFTKERSK